MLCGARPSALPRGSCSPTAWAALDRSCLTLRRRRGEPGSLVTGPRPARARLWALPTLRARALSDLRHVPRTSDHTPFFPEHLSPSCGLLPTLGQPGPVVHPVPSVPRAAGHSAGTQNRFVANGATPLPDVALPVRAGADRVRCAQLQHRPGGADGARVRRKGRTWEGGGKGGGNEVPAGRGVPFMTPRDGAPGDKSRGEGSGVSAAAVPWPGCAQSPGPGTVVWRLLVLGRDLSKHVSCFGTLIHLSILVPI